MYLSDIHTHSIASGHGTSCTISQMAKAASGKGLKDIISRIDPDNNLFINIMYGMWTGGCGPMLLCRSSMKHRAFWKNSITGTVL